MLEDMASNGLHDFTYMHIHLPPQKHLIARTVRHFFIRIPDILQETRQLDILLLPALNPSQYLGHITTVVPVMEQTNIHARLQRVQKLEQCAAALGKLKHEQVLVCGVAAAAD